MAAAIGMVITQATTMSLAMFQRTADTLRAAPTPTIAPVIAPPGRQGPAYRSWAASTSRRSTFSRATYTGSVMNGRNAYVMPAMTAIGVARMWNCSGSRPIALSGPSTGPESPRMIFQLIVRSRKLVKKGATTRNSSRFLYRPPLNAMVYASG